MRGGQDVLKYNFLVLYLQSNIYTQAILLSKDNVLQAEYI